MDLKKLTELELIDLHNRVKEELDHYEKRTKVKVFKIMAFGEPIYYKNVDTALEELNSMIENHGLQNIIEEESLIVSSVYMSESEVETYCY